MTSTLTGKLPLFLPWLVRLLSDETRTFRDAVIGSNFGSSPSKHAERCLTDQENEMLLTAGFGFALLTSLLVGTKNKGEKSMDDQRVEMRQLILPELPGNDARTKLTFVRKTLVAFCNLYHYSVNEDLSLSMLVLAPVKKLLVELDPLIDGETD